MAKSLWLSILPLCIALAVFASDRKENVLVYGIVGSETGKYSEIMSIPAVQTVLLAIAETPRDRNFIEQGLSGTQKTIRDLEGLSLIRQKENR